jgi:diguanylate cyclase (GGDEF)-like protein
MPSDTLPRIAWLAERLAAVFESGSASRSKEIFAAVARESGISSNDIDDMVQRLPGLVADAAAVFDRDLGPQPGFEALMADAHRALLEMNRDYETMVRDFERVLIEKEELAAELVSANEQLKLLAATDGLTGLPNKRAFEEALHRDLSRADREGSALSLIVLDLDEFKKVNDTHGHSVGDDVLRMSSSVLKRSLRTGDVAARYGGEELVVILPKTDAAGARVVAERLRSAIALSPVVAPAGSIHVTASVGVATVHGPGCRETAARLFEAADGALYDAKRAGRNRVCVARSVVSLPASAMQ